MTLQISLIPMIAIYRAEDANVYHIWSPWFSKQVVRDYIVLHGPYNIMFISWYLCADSEVLVWLLGRNPCNRT